MSAALADGPAVTVATDAQIADAGALTAEAYLADRLLLDDDPYELELRDAARRAVEATLLVATVEAAPGVGEAGGATAVRTGGAADGAGVAGSTTRSRVVVGTVTLAPYGTSYAEVAQPGELELRMLAVAPEARGRGVAEALMRAALRQGVQAGCRRVVLSTLDEMATAQRLYDRLGFVEQPNRRWGRTHQLAVRTWTPPPAPGVLVESASWPPVRVEVTSGGWRVGVSGGITRRANSAMTTEGRADAAQQIDEVEAIYQAAGRSPIVRVGASASDRLIEAELEARGYRVVSDADVMVRTSTSRLPARGGPSCTSP